MMTEGARQRQCVRRTEPDRYDRQWVLKPVLLLHVVIVTEPDLRDVQSLPAAASEGSRSSAITIKVLMAASVAGPR
jgi:hypothetical protein